MDDNTPPQNPLPQPDVVPAVNPVPPPPSSPPPPASSPPNKSFFRFNLFDFHQMMTNHKFPFLAGMVLLILFLLVFAVSILSVYTTLKIPFLSQAARGNLVMFYYNLPFFPKTSEQILMAAVQNNAKLGTYKPNFSLSAKLSNSDVTIANLDLKVGGPVSFLKDKNMSFDLDAEAALNFAGSKINLSGKIKKIEDIYYLKLNNIPDYLLSFYRSQTADSNDNTEINNNLSKVLENWMIYDTKGLETEARKNLDSNSQQSIVEQARESTQKFLLKANVLAEIKRMNDDNIQGILTYHLRLTPSKELLKSIIKEYGQEDKSLKLTPGELDKIATAYTDSLQMMQLDVWFGKKDAILRKTSLIVTTKLDFLSSLMSGYGKASGSVNTVLGASETALPGVDFLTSLLSLSSVLEIQDIGNPVTVVAPSKTVSAMEYWGLLQNSLKTKKQLEIETKRKQIDKDLSELNSDLSLYFADNNSKYPASITALQGKYLLASSPVQKSLNYYLYKVSLDGKRYVLYAMFTDDNYSSSSDLPYYGLTSSYSYARQLTTYDFEVLTTPSYSEPTPLPYSVYPTYAPYQ